MSIKAVCHRHLATRTLSPWIICCVALVSSCTYASDTLRQRYAALSQSYHNDAARELRGTIYIKDNVANLRAHFARLSESGQGALAATMIVANLPLILENIDSDHTQRFLSTLLKNEILQSATTVAEHARDFGSSFTSSRMQYELARYYFNHDNVQLVLKHLAAIENSDALNRDQQDFATLLFGIALQKQKKHREALKIYERIDERSIYFSFARLNAAVANIRQGWWTDAQLAIEQAWQKNPPQHLKETNNRLLLVLGYSQLQNEFYKDARNTFRKISLDSRYVNRALLGIGLCAIQLKDYNAAINMFSRLQQGDTNELTVMESYLLIPFTFERVGDASQASSLYTEAIAFYENKLLALKSQANDDISAISHSSGLPSQKIAFYETILNATHTHSNANIQKKSEALKKLARQTLRQELAELRQQKMEAIQSYLSQSQYGLAKIYDAEN